MNQEGARQEATDRVLWAWESASAIMDKEGARIQGQGAELPECPDIAAFVGLHIGKMGRLTELTDLFLQQLTWVESTAPLHTVATEKP